MSDTRNAFSQPLVEPTQGLIQPGDVALVLKADGTTQALTFGYDRARLSLPADQQTEDDQKMLLQGAKLFALAFAAGHPKLMNTLINIASDPDVADLDTLRASSVRH